MNLISYYLQRFIDVVCGSTKVSGAQRKQFTETETTNNKTGDGPFI